MRDFLKIELSLGREHDSGGRGDPEGRKKGVEKSMGFFQKMGAEKSCDFE